MRIDLNQDWLFQECPQLESANWDKEIATVAGDQIRVGEKTLLSPGQENLDSVITVTIPHTWYSGADSYHGTVLYQKALPELPFEQEKQRMFIRFGAVSRVCRVYLNGKLVGEHQGGYAQFSLELSNYYQPGDKNWLQVLVDDRSFDFVSPLAGDFTCFGGIYRGVELLVTSRDCFDHAYYGTDGVSILAQVESNPISGLDTHTGQVKVIARTLAKTDYSLLIEVFAPDQGKVCEQSKTLKPGRGEQIFNLSVPEPKLWNGLGQGNLYRLVSSLIVAGEVTDQVEMTFGFRSLDLDPEQGFFLNGTRLRLNGVAKHQDHGATFAAVTQKEIAEDFAVIEEIGANALRLSHYQHPQAAYDYCDRNGIVVWAEIPLLKHSTDPRFLANARLQLRELILQNLHHPSICFWGIQNEAAMFGETSELVSDLAELTEYAKELDPSRITAAANLYCVANDSPLNQQATAVGYNIYYGWYYGEIAQTADFIERFHRDNPQVPLGITEYGVDANLKFHADQPQVKDYSEEFQAQYHQQVYSIFKRYPYLWGTFVWNLFDFSSEIRSEGESSGINAKGLVSYDRSVKKDAFYYYQAQWSKQPMLKIAGARFKNRVVPTTQITVYSNQTRVQLETANYCRELRSDDGVFVFSEVPLVLGENRVLARSGDLSEEIILVGVDTPDPSYVFVDPNPGINVKNWFIDQVEEELFPPGFYSIRDSSQDIVSNAAALAAVAEYSASLAARLAERPGKMTLERILHYLRTEFNDQDCQELNRYLTKVPKP